MSEAIQAPRWLAEEEWLQKLLHWFVDRLDAPRNKAITRRVSETTVPALFKFSEETNYRWKLVKDLATDYSIFDINLDRVGRGQVAYDNAQLRLNPSCENLLRDWLCRPRIDPAQAAWRAAVAQYADRFIDSGSSLLGIRPQELCYDPAQLAKSFAAIGDVLDQELSLREIAARCFRGDSKFLDNRYDLLEKMFGQRTSLILPRPLLLTAFAPLGFTQLLIVENQDSFLRLVDQKPNKTALLYSGGFRASAGRLLSAHTRFSFLADSAVAEFLQRWRTPDLPMLFWGDLDFSGMGILASLRQSLPRLKASQDGYAPMLQDLEKGLGHLPSEASKGMQIDPKITGCTYCDDTLLPAIRRAGRFIDQEGYLLRVE